MDYRIELEKWLDEIKNYKTPKIDDFPNIDLYMDQILTYMEKLLKPFMREEKDKLITSSMINNYVKANLIPNPISKKYSNLHLSYILAICNLKQIIPISDINKLFDNLNPEEFYSLYENFRNVQDVSLTNIGNRVKKTISSNNKELDEDFLKTLAINMAIEANANKIVAERIIYLIEKKHQIEIEELKQKMLTDDPNTKKKQPK